MLARRFSCETVLANYVGECFSQYCLRCIVQTLAVREPTATGVMRMRVTEHVAAMIGDQNYIQSFVSGAAKQNWCCWTKPCSENTAPMPAASAPIVHVGQKPAERPPYPTAARAPLITTKTPKNRGFGLFGGCVAPNLL